jgi:phage tail-like protein
VPAVPDDAGQAGELAPAAPATIPVSSYLQYLPAPYHADPFVGRYLMIVETILSSIEGKVDNLHYYFDPMVTPEELLPWLASWVGVELDENMPVAKRRVAIATAAGLYRWQGTRRAVRERLRAYTGTRPLIVENCDGMRLGQDAALGVNTRLGQARPYTMAITVAVDSADDVDPAVLRRIVDAEKPAHVTYTLEVRVQRRRAEQRPPGGDPDAAPPPAAPWVVRMPLLPGDRFVDMSRDTPDLPATTVLAVTPGGVVATGTSASTTSSISMAGSITVSIAADAPPAPAAPPTPPTPPTPPAPPGAPN